MPKTTIHAGGTEHPADAAVTETDDPETYHRLREQQLDRTQAENADLRSQLEQMKAQNETDAARRAEAGYEQASAQPRTDDQTETGAQITDKGDEPADRKPVSDDRKVGDEQGADARTGDVDSKAKTDTTAAGNAKDNAVSSRRSDSKNSKK